MINEKIIRFKDDQPNKWMNEWILGCMGESINKGVNGWKNELINI